MASDQSEEVRGCRKREREEAHARRVGRAAQCEKEVDRLTQNYGNSCSFSTRQGSADYELAWRCTELALGSKGTSAALRSCLAHPSTPLPKVCIALIHSCSSWGSTTAILQPRSTFQAPQDAVHYTFENGRFFESATSRRIKSRIPGSSSFPPLLLSLLSLLLQPVPGFSLSQVCFSNFLTPVSWSI